MTPTLVFDIETIPDIAGLRTLYEVDSAVSDTEVAEMAFQMRRQRTGSDFLQHHLQRVVAISCTLREGDSFRVWTLGGLEEGEGSLVQRFFDGIEKYTPQLVSWNGGGFDLPVLHYRGLIHGVQSPRYWDMGEDDREFKWNNYISRYHTRHLDLMDLLAMYTGRANAPLDELAKLIGFPGKLGMDGSKVWEAYQQGRLAEIRNYCETDVVNTWLVYLRFQLMRGQLTREQYQRECDLVRATLGKQEAPHWQEYLAAWPV
ncbi:3-5 exonuclease [Ferriphaselus amnicola]|uniref:3-5 exonuclease n=1 Tax=Ferriphaselus amnicola TaxID=1188319 RepID=A0A2Z6GDA4_9PROT|nr:3'-5' exonuclease [Ferriphaselus amnicola]BBE51332.1 3-5 exonuclease [Ferriphaselus amnicola]